MIIKEEIRPTSDSAWSSQQVSIYFSTTHSSVCFIDVESGNEDCEVGVTLRCEERSKADAIWEGLMAVSDIVLADLKSMGFKPY